MRHPFSHILALLLLSAAGGALAQTTAPKPAAPVSILPPIFAPQPAAKPTSAPTNVLPPVIGVPPVVVPPVVIPVVIPHWTSADVQSLIASIRVVGQEGLFPADYQPDALQLALLGGEGPALDDLATRQFGRLAADLRDGRTPFSARVQWYVRDPDAAAMPTDALLTEALASHDFAITLAKLTPKNADYAALKVALAATPAANTARIKLIRTNMERWRWLPNDLGFRHVIANVPEMQLRFVVNSKLVRSYKAVVGKPGETATPQLAEQAQAVIFNPTWTVPQSIIKNELGGMISRSPGGGSSGNYTWTRYAGGGVSVVQKAGPNNALGLMKLDMPNAHSIFIHDTPARERFNQANRALSHGCVRAERASELGLLLAIVMGGISGDDGVAILTSGKTTKVPFKEKIPVYVAYFTMATGLDGKMQPFGDVYGRDAAVFASLDKPREDKAVGEFQKAPVIVVKDPGI
jgi:L,D-transpeptidase YcbB